MTEQRSSNALLIHCCFKTTATVMIKRILLQQKHLPPTLTQDFNNTRNSAGFVTQEPLPSDNIPPISRNNFDTNVTQYPHTWPQYIIRFTLYVVSVGRPHGPFRSDTDQPQRMQRVLHTQTRGHLKNVYFLCLHKPSTLTVNVTLKKH
jgi:hypothetical protein